MDYLLLYVTKLYLTCGPPFFGLTFTAGGYFENDIESKAAYKGTDGDGSVKQDGDSATSSATSTRVGGVFSFKEKDVVSRLGISWISSSRACQHVQDEIPAETSLQSVVDDAKSEWEKTVFSKVTTTNTNDTSLTLLYSSLYFMHLIPTNQTGENPGWESDEPYYQDIFTFWVGMPMRSVYRLLTLWAGHLPLLNRTHAHPAADFI